MSNPAERARRSARQNFRIGLLAIALSLAALYLAFAGLPFRGGYEVSGIFRSASQIHANSPVRIAGVSVGKVTKVQRGPAGTAKVTMRIDAKGRPIHRDAILKIRPRLFLEGNFFVDIRPGSASAPELAEGDTVPLTQTATPVQFDQILTALNAPTRDDLKVVLKEYAAALDKGGAQAINESFKPAEGAFKGLALLSQEAQGLTRDDIARFLQDNTKFATTVNARRAQLADLVTNFNRTVGALAAQSGNVQATTRGFADLVDEAYPALADVNAALPPLRSLARELRPLARRSPKTLDLALPLLQQLNRLVGPGELPPLLRDARPTLRALATLEPKLTGLFDQVTPIGRCTADNVVPTLNSVVDDGHLSTGMKVWQEFLAASVGLSSAAQNFDGNGTNVRLLAGGGDQTVAVGSLPGVGPLLGSSVTPLIGSRPAKPAHRPPFRPEVDCTTQKRPDLKAAFRAAPAVPKGARMAPAPSRTEVRSLIGALKSLRTRLEQTGRQPSGPAIRSAIRKAITK